MRGEFLAVAPAEFLPALDAVPVPLPQRRARRDILQPRFGREAGGETAGFETAIRPRIAA